MKLFDVEWIAVLRDLHRWTDLSADARHVLLAELKTSGYTNSTRFGAHLDEVVASGLARHEPERGRLSLAEERRTLLKVLRAMGRHRVFDNATIPALINYMQEHFTQADIEEQRGPTGYGRATRESLASRVSSAPWPGDLLNAFNEHALLAWASERGRTPAAGTSLEALRALQTVVRTLRKRTTAMPLGELIAPHDAATLPALARTLYLGLDMMVLFVGLRSRDLEPMIGLWPGALAELSRPPAAKPTAVVPTEQFELAVQMEDMTTLLAAIVSAPVRVRNDDVAVFARTRAEIELRLTVLPDWALPLMADPVLTRVDVAASALRLHGLVTIASHHNKPHLESGARGGKWLALSPHDRLASLIVPMRNSKLRNPIAGYGADAAVEFFSFALPYYQEPKALHLRESITRAFLDLPNGFVAFDAFLDHASREANPFLALSPEASRQLQHSMYFGGSDARASYQSMWRSALERFLANRLVGLGGATLGRTTNGALCFALTDAGRYLLGAQEQFAYGTASDAEIVVQPNFDVVFLGVAPSIEARIARVADRVGVAPGLVFRISRASVLRAAESGVTADEVIGTLSDASTKPVPKNVQREIVGWVATIRRARLRAIQVIDCESAEAADRIAVVLGAKAHRLTPTLFELPIATPAARAATLRRLRVSGLFIDDQAGKVVAPPKRKRREPVWDDGDEE